MCVAPVFFCHVLIWLSMWYLCLMFSEMHYLATVVVFLRNIPWVSEICSVNVVNLISFCAILGYLQQRDWPEPWVWLCYHEHWGSWQSHWDVQPLCKLVSVLSFLCSSPELKQNCNPLNLKALILCIPSCCGLACCHYTWKLNCLERFRIWDDHTSHLMEKRQSC